MLYFNISQKLRFKKVLDLARKVSNSSNAEDINILANDLLNVINDHNMQRNLSMIKKEADMFGLLFIGEGAKISRSFLLNFLVSDKISLSMFFELLILKDV